ncbi:MAG: methyltransferase domain-containing protein, partial [Candidatus Omnitrophica bacterium]|nr:methyltransferase domain-containing protein [Candidatus Omnitrophota bacterium]
MNAVKPPQRCSICEEGVLHETLKLSDSAQIVECSICKIAALEPMPGPQELAAAYPDDSYYSYAELGAQTPTLGVAQKIRNALRHAAYSGRMNPNGSSRFLNRWVAWLLQGRFSGFPIRKTPGRLLDVGCGDGYFLSFCRRAGWKVTGVEQS